MLPLLASMSWLALPLSMPVSSPDERLQSYASPDSPHDVEPLRVVGGKPVKSCQWPTTMLLDTGRFTCTGTLVHPKIFITAAHCLKGNTFTVYSGDGNKGENKKTLIERKPEYCRKHPKFSGTRNTPKLDFAYCKLREPVKDIAPMPIMMGCEVDYLKSNSDLDVVVAGYGYIKPGDRSRIGTKYEVDTKFLGISQGLAKVGVKGKGPLQGDSGGPVFIKLPEDKFNKDAGWRVFGITSTSRGSGAPDGQALYGMVHTFVEYLEKDSGIDVTPCTDADGTWNPTKDCKGAVLDPYEASGDWVKGCEPGKPGGFISSCGDPFAGSEEPEDSTPPEVTISSPQDGEVFAPDTDEIIVKVSVKDKSDIETVKLSVNKKSQKVLKDKPYTWSLESLKVGTYALVATAVDAAGNEGQSETLKFEIKGDSDEGDDSESSGDESAGSNKPDEESPDGDRSQDGDEPQATPGKEPDERSSDPQATGKAPGSGCAVVGSPRGWQALWGLLWLGLWLRRRTQA